MWGFTSWRRRVDDQSLRHVASAISKQYKVKVIIDPTTTECSARVREKEITIGTKELDIHGTDHYVGAILHEIGHIKYSPIQKGTPTEKMIRNMFEDKRIERLMGDDYEGADYFIEELHEPVYRAITAQLWRPLPYGELAHYTLDIMLDEIAKGAENEHRRTSPYDEKSIEKARHVAIEKAKSILLKRVLGIAVLTAEGRREYGMDVGHKGAQRIAERIGELLRKATTATSEEIEAYTKEGHRLLLPLLPEDNSAPEHDILTLSSRGGGLKPADIDDMSENGRKEEIATETNEEIEPLLDRMKKKLIAFLRDTERQKYRANKRRGLLDKKSIQRVARDNFRIYRKREEKKGKSYTLSVVLDASGSMFGGYGRIVAGMRASLLLLKAFRSLGFKSSLTVYGHEAITPLDYNQLFRAEEIDQRFSTYSHDYWRSPDNATATAIQHALPRLRQVGQGTHKLMIIITDGGLDSDDVAKSAGLLKKEEKRGDFTAILFYVESNTARILADEKREIEIREAIELPEKAAKLLSNMITA